MLPSPIRLPSTGVSASQDPAVGTLAVGAVGELARHFDIEDVRAFAALAGDDNPLHLDADFAAAGRFGRRVVHGMLYGSLISTIFGAQIPGSVYVSQSFRFRRPVYVGDTVVARVEVTRVATAPRHLVTCRTTVSRRVAEGSPGGKSRAGGTADDGRSPIGAGLGEELCLDGEATVLLPPLPLR
jgi:3-hydroxybutyryl-CoA dehydratase